MPIADAAAWQMLDELIANKQDDVTFRTSSELMVNITRLLVKRGILQPENVTYQFNDTVIGIDKDARIHQWPHGFCDNMQRVLEELFGV